MFRQGCNGLASGQPAVGVDVTPPLPPLCDTDVAVGVGACTGIGTAGEAGAAARIASLGIFPQKTSHPLPGTASSN